MRNAAEAQMVYGVPVADFIMNHRDPFDFQLSVKVPRGSRLQHGNATIQNNTRYYVSTDGAPLTVSQARSARIFCRFHICGQ